MVSPGTRIAHAVGPPQVPVAPPGAAVALYVVMAAPPSEAGAVKATDADALPGVTDPITGAPGTACAVTWLDGSDVAPAGHEGCSSSRGNG